MKTQRIYKAWARRRGTNNEFVTTEIKASTLKEAEKWFNDNNYELAVTTQVYLSCKQ